VAAIALTLATSAPRSVVEPASAATVLRDLSATAAKAPPTHGRYAYQHTRTYTTHELPRRGGGTFAMVIPHDTEVWVTRSGRRAVFRERFMTDQATFPTPRDREAYESSPTLPPAVENGVVVSSGPLTFGTLTADQLRALPTDPAVLRRRLDRVRFGQAPDVLVSVCATVLQSPLTPAKVRAAVLQVLRRLRGAMVVRGARDPLGRTGAAIEFTDRAWRTLFVFDPKTSALLATRSIGRYEMSGRTITDWHLQLEAGWRDSAPRATPRLTVPPLPPRVAD